MMNQNIETLENNQLLGKVGKPDFSSKSVANQATLNPQQLEKELEADAKRNAHKRNESLQNIKITVIGWIFKGILPFVLILMLCWAIACYLNANEIKTGIEWLLSNILFGFLGTLIGKFL